MSISGHANCTRRTETDWIDRQRRRLAPDAGAHLEASAETQGFTNAFVPA